MKISFLAPPTVLSPYCWLIEMGSRKLGVHQKNGWCMQLEAQVVFFDSEDMCVPLMPILEIDAQQFSDLLANAAIMNHTYSECIIAFPKELLIKHVFRTSCSDYWPERALSWLSFYKTIQSLFKTELEEFVLNKVMSQGVRQKAKKMLKELNQPADCNIVLH